LQDFPFFPTEMNQLFGFLQGPYDVRFGNSFYDCSWFVGYDQAKTLAKVQCPSVLIHTNWNYDENGILMAAMDADDAQRASSLIPGNELIKVDSGHTSHQELPEQFVQILRDFKSSLGL